ncbi:hypothetical protein AHAS_Ahas03G0188200 [Arachis hypogaea]
MSWAIAYIHGCFYAGLRTTSRCESLHAKMGRFMERRYGILVFVTNFQRCVDFLRDNEEELDFSCLRFESFGLPCVHILVVLVQLDIGCLPESIVLERWSKTVKVELEGSSPMNEEGDVNAVYKVQIVEETAFLEMKNGIGTAGKYIIDGADEEARYPVVVRTKGTGRAQEPFGCRGRKRHKCSTCGVVDHHQTRCSSGPPSQPTCSQDPTEDIVPHSESQSHALIRTVTGDEDQSQRGSKTVCVIATPLTDN